MGKRLLFIAGIILVLIIGSGCALPWQKQVDQQEGQAQEEANRTATKQYDFGVYVDVIEGVKGEKGYYWIYYINGTPAMQAADQYKVQPNDVIEWKYEAEKAGL